jgi:uncharacterized membrane protein YdjX (TVP38/TMEM64 family)
MIPDTTPDIRKETGRLIVGACLVAGIIALLYFTPLKQWLESVRELKDRIDHYGWKAHAIFIVGSVAGIAVGVPRLVLCGMGGFFFGFVEGLLASQFAGVLGSYGAFLITRLWAPKEWVQRKLANSDRLKSVLEKPSIGSIFVARQLPVPGIVPNVLLGVLNTSHFTFLIGTFVGYLPSNIPVALAGSSMGKESLMKAIGQVSTAMLALGIFSALIMWIRRRVK